MNSTRPDPPYYAVIFTSLLADPAPGYEAMADQIFDLAQTQPGFLGAESCRGADGFGITVSYWCDEASITLWKAQSDHRIAQEIGMTTWYRSYHLHVARVERAYGKADGLV